MISNFYGAILKPGTPICACVADGSSSGEDELDYRRTKTVHLTQLALPGSAKEGHHTVYAQDEDGSEYVLGTLNIATCPNVKLDILLVDQELGLRVEGPSEVHVTGYETLSYEEDGYDEYDSEDDYEYDHLLSGSSDDEEEEEEDDDGDHDSDDDSDDVPEGIPLGMRKLPSPDEDDEFDGDDIDDSDIDMDEDDQEEDDEDDDSEEDDSEEEEEGDDDSDDSDDSEEEEDAIKKRAGKLLTPQPSKKAKVDKSQAPATAPSKVSTKKAPTNEQEYTKALKEYLGLNGPSKLAVLGSSIKRPSAVPKLKRFLSTHASDFVYNQSNDTVYLA